LVGHARRAGAYPHHRFGRIAGAARPKSAAPTFERHYRLPARAHAGVAGASRRAADPGVLRDQSKAGDSRRAAILLVGGDKTGREDFYATMIPLADRLYDEHLAEIAADMEGKDDG
jgi:hypothetical protein